MRPGEYAESGVDGDYREAMRPWRRGCMALTCAICAIEEIATGLLARSEYVVDWVK